MDVFKSMLPEHGWQIMTFVYQFIGPNSLWVCPGWAAAPIPEFPMPRHSSTYRSLQTLYFSQVPPGAQLWFSSLTLSDIPQLFHCSRLSVQYWVSVQFFLPCYSPPGEVLSLLFESQFTELWELHFLLICYHFPLNLNFILFLYSSEIILLLCLVHLIPIHANILLYMYVALNNF